MLPELEMKTLMDLEMALLVGSAMLSNPLEHVHSGGLCISVFTHMMVQCKW